MNEDARARAKPREPHQWLEKGSRGCDLGLLKDFGWQARRRNSKITPKTAQRQCDTLLDWINFVTTTKGLIEFNLSFVHRFEDGLLRTFYVFYKISPSQGSHSLFHSPIRQLDLLSFSLGIAFLACMFSSLNMWWKELSIILKELSWAACYFSI